MCDAECPICTSVFLALPLAMLTRLHRQADSTAFFCADLKNTQLPLPTAIGHPNSGVQTFGIQFS